MLLFSLFIPNRRPAAAGSLTLFHRCVADNKPHLQRSATTQALRLTKSLNRQCGRIRVTRFRDRCKMRRRVNEQSRTMPIHMDILPLDRLVVIVARGHVTAEEIAENTKKLVAANVPAYAKIIDVTASKSDLTREQVEKVAALLRGDPRDTRRGAVAFVVDPGRQGFAEAFADVTRGERPIQLFRSLHAARRWLLEGAAGDGALPRDSAHHDGVRVWE
ncbi:MAG: hypothetical protein KIS73_18030 [Enhydrobacter sp.]|nr:hypothetical protein [Enhydrobacter sp.]